MDDFGSSSGGFSSSDAAGFSTDAGGCGAFSSSDTGGISSSCGAFSDSGPFIIDTSSHIGMTSNCDPGLGVSDNVQCDITGNNAYYNACFQNSMESENVSVYPYQIQMDSSLSSDPIPVMPSAPYLTTTTYGVVDGYLNMGGHVNCWEEQSTCNQREDKESMLLRSEIAQLQIILASSKGDENKRAAVMTQIWDLTARMERKGNMRGQYNQGLRNCPNHVTAVTRLNKPDKLYLRPTDAGVDMQSIQKAQRNSCICGIIIVIIFAAIFAVIFGVTFTLK